MISALVLATLVAQAPPPSPSPVPSDPCTSLSALVTRPTVTNAVCTVRPNHVEIEGGYQNTTAPDAGNTVIYPQALVRVGTAVPALEVQVTPPQAMRTSAGGTLTGTTDTGFGLKYVLGYTPTFSYGVQANWTVPTGSAAFSAGATQSIYALQAGYTLSPAFSLFGGVQDQLLAAGGARYGSFVPTLGVSAALPGSTSLYAEIAQFTKALGPGSATRTQYITGVSHGVGPRLQVDAEAGWSPTTATGRYRYVGFGFGAYF